MRMLGYAIGFMLASTLVGNVAAQPIDSVKVSDGIHMLIGKGGNIGVLIGEDGTFMIDDKFAPMTDTILAKVTQLGGSTPRFVINTHFHSDHTGGNEHLGEAGSAIISHTNVRNRLAQGTTVQAFDLVIPSQPKEALPIITFRRDISFHINGETINIEHVPAAHTDGDSIVHFQEANVIHAGDTVFNGFFPFIDTDHGGTVSNRRPRSAAMRPYGRSLPFVRGVGHPGCHDAGRAEHLLDPAMHADLFASAHDKVCARLTTARCARPQGPPS